VGEPILAIDYGTCHASAALAIDGQVEAVREPASGVVSWPSSVFADGDTLVVGTLAERRKRIWPAAYRGAVKRDLARDLPVALDGRSYPPAALVTAVLSALKTEAEAQLGGEPLARAVVTVPASYAPGGPLRKLMISAAEAAGIVDVDLLPEPVAAAWAPLPGAHPDPGELMLVYDLGGGTFDAALIAVGEAGRHELLGHSSLHDCGGRDLDQLLFDEILGQYGPGLEPLLNPTGIGEVFQTAASRTRHELVDFARAVKHQLTDVAVVEDVFGPAGLLVSIDRDRFTKLASPTLARTMACCQHLLEVTGTPPEKLGGVLLVGGCSRLPVVADILAARLGVGTDWPGQQLFIPPDPELAIVRGAATWAASVSTRRTTAARPSPVVQPARWDIPGGSATMVRWLVKPGARFEAGTVLARVRLTDGSLFDLAAEAPGSLIHTQAAPGTPVTDADWLATTIPTAPTPMGSARPADLRGIERSQRPSHNVEVTSRATLSGHERDVTSCAFSPDGRLLATTSKDGARLWDTTTGRSHAVFASRKNTVLHGCAFSPDGRLLVVTGIDKTARIWDVGSAKQTMTFAGHKGPVYGCAFSPDGLLLATTSNDGTRLTDTPTGTTTMTLGGSAQSCAFSPDGLLLAAASTDDVARLWDVATGTPVATLSGHSSTVMSCAFAPYGLVLATTSTDKTARLWEIIYTP
jgi:Hsp70 protein/WD domain, G-beta repeat